MVESLIERRLEMRRGIRVCIFRYHIKTCVGEDCSREANRLSSSGRSLEYWKILMVSEMLLGRIKMTADRGQKESAFQTVPGNCFTM